MYHPPVGDYLGDLTSELSPNEHITTFCSTGSKSYAYITNKGNTVCKVKGITLNHRNSLIINVDTMRNVVHEEVEHVKVVNPNMIQKNKKKCWIVYNVKQEKVFRQVYEKRKIVGNFDTEPWGYKK